MKTYTLEEVRTCPLKAMLPWRSIKTIPNNITVIVADKYNGFDYARKSVDGWRSDCVKFQDAILWLPATPKRRNKYEN